MVASVLVARSVVRAGCLVAALPLAIAAGCGASDRPPELGDVTGGDPDGSTTMPGFDYDSGPPTCTGATPEGGICACTDLSLLIDVPNLYIVLDRSGSMTQLNKWETVRVVTAQVMGKIGRRANFGAAMFPDPTKNGCVPGAEFMSVRPGDPPQPINSGLAGPTEIFFLEATAGVGASGGTPTAPTFTGLLPHLTGLNGRTYVILATDGGPNCNGAISCTVDQCIPNIESAGGCFPNTPPNCCDPTQYGSENCLDSAATVDAIASLKAANIPVYVIGVPGSGPYAALLDQMAMAGGTARSSEPYYYQVNTADEATFFAALSQIAAKITATCNLKLAQTPPDVSMVNVYFDNVAVPQDPVDGWSITGNIVTLLGASCQKVLDGQVLDVRVVAGCPTVIR